MRRREFVKAAAVVMALSAVPTVAAPKSWDDMTLEEIAEDFAHRRRMGVTPNFECRHRCPRCGVEYLCPDRYVMAECWSTKLMQTCFKDTSCTPISCAPCCMNVEAHGPVGYRQLWLEAHAV